MFGWDAGHFRVLRRFDAQKALRQREFGFWFELLCFCCFSSPRFSSKRIGSHHSQARRRGSSPPPPRPKVVHVEVETCACLDIYSHDCCTYVTQVCDWFEDDALDCDTAAAFCDKDAEATVKIKQHFEGELEECSKSR